VLAPNAEPRAAIVPDPAHKPNEHAAAHAHPSVQIGWARLLKRVFVLDLEHCPWCGGDMKSIAAIEDPHRLGSACQSPAARTGAAARSVRSRLILKPIDRVAEGEKVV